MTSSDFDRYNVPAEVERVLEQCLSELARERFEERIWIHDAGLWPGDTDEIARRLGWLHLESVAKESQAELRRTRDHLLKEGYTDVVLLGMGGSSLGAEVIATTLGQRGDLKMHVLDSTVPGAVAHVCNTVGLSHCAFVVSSKSGGTLEPNLLYEYFRALLEREGGDGTGRHFIAITDAGTSLERLATEAGFRQVYLNPADIGGRYSVLSLFGLLPGTLAGADPGRLHDAAAAMARRCAPTSGANPGTALGAFMAGCTRCGRNKLTIVTTPSLRSFGWWAEQLIAESTGKDGTGIVPVVDEPLLAPASYPDDRAFVYMRLTSEDNARTDVHLRALADIGQPCVTIELGDAYELGGEFFRWEYATACAGSLMHINPFNQPNVQSAKDASSAVLEHYVTEGRLPRTGPTSSPGSLLAGLPQGSYLAVMAYLRRRDEVDEVMASFRRRIGERYRLATTFGYGPRLLHSTGQLHKGGPATGRFVQIVSGHTPDVPLPGRPYSFGIAADAQALGDLQALRALGRPVARITLEKDDSDLLAHALSELG